LGIGEICLLGVGLSMDAFAVSICKGLQMRKFNWKQALWMGIFFGGFQALMPLTGWLLGALFAKHIMRYSHWIAFVLLAFIGGKMLLESIRQKKEEPSEETAVCPNKVDFRELFLLAVATSIDALAVGVTFSIMPDVNIFLSILLIGSITFLFALAGVKIGNLFGDRFEKQTGILGGCILLAIGVKILLEGLGIIG
jgi:putative Mn2+ efflux pump MntP